MSSDIGFDAFHPFDFVLVHGSGLTSKLIRLFDGGDYNHVFLVKDAATLAQADWGGIAEAPLRPAIEQADYVLVRRLSATTPDWSPVERSLGKYLAEHDRYAYEQILLLAALATTRKIPLPPVVKPLLRTLLDHAASLINDLIAHGKQPMICSEFCYRVYEDADGNASGPFHIAIDLSRAVKA